MIGKKLISLQFVITYHLDWCQNRRGKWLLAGYKQVLAFPAQKELSRAAIKFLIKMGFLHLDVIKKHCTGQRLSSIPIRFLVSMPLY